MDVRHDGSPIDTPWDDNDRYYLHLDDLARELLGAVKVTKAYGCPRAQHDSKRLCGCPRAVRALTEKDKLLFANIHLVHEWEQHLVRTEAAYDHVIDSADHVAAFERKTGASPELFARRFAEDLFATPAMLEPATSLEETRRALLVFWDEAADGWRRRYESHAALRSKHEAAVPEQPDVRFPDGRVLNTTEPQPAKYLVLRRVRIKMNQGHESTEFLMLLKPDPADESDVKHKIIGVRPCHEDCARRLVLSDEFLSAMFQSLNPRASSITLEDAYKGKRRLP